MMANSIMAQFHDRPSIAQNERVFRFFEMPHKHSLPHTFSLLLDFREQKRDEESKEVKRNIIR